MPGGPGCFVSSAFTISSICSRPCAIEYTVAAFAAGTTTTPSWSPMIASPGRTTTLPQLITPGHTTTSESMQGKERGKASSRANDARASQRRLIRPQKNHKKRKRRVFFFFLLGFFSVFFCAIPSPRACSRRRKSTTTHHAPCRGRESCGPTRAACGSPAPAR